MNQNFFHQLHDATPTRLWINNPTEQETIDSLAAGAINCTTNPAYCARLLKVESEYMRSLFKQCLRTGITCSIASRLVYQKAVQRLIALFANQHQQTNGAEGFVTLQDDPTRDTQTDPVVACMLEGRALGPNFMAKIPVIDGSLQAIGACVEENIPLCATEIFAIAQVTELLNVYEKAAGKSGNRPPMFITHITGIFDEYLKKHCVNENIKIDPAVLRQAGTAVAFKELDMLEKRGFTILGGGARDTCHFTNFIGTPIHITINWSTAVDIMNMDRPASDFKPVRPEAKVVDELLEKLPVFRQAYMDDGLALADFAAYGPVQLFRNAFLKGWYELMAAVAGYRNENAI